MQIDTGIMAADLRDVARQAAAMEAMGYDGLAGLHQQIERVLSALREASTAKEKR